MSALGLDTPPEPTGTVSDRSDYGDSPAPTDMANSTTTIDRDDSRVARGIDR